MSPQCLPPSFSSIRLSIRGQMRFTDFQDGHLGGHLRYQTRTILAIWNLCVTLMPPIKFGSIRIMVWEEMSKFGLNQTHHWEQTWFEDFQNCHHRAILDIRMNDLSNSDYLCCSNPPIKFQPNPTYSLGQDVL